MTISQQTPDTVLNSRLSTATSPSAYYDLQSLASLKKDAGKSSENLAGVAQQFESLFMKMILDSARKANEVFGEDNYLNSRESEFYQQMMDDQLSTELTKGQGLGIAAMLVKQLSPYVKTTAGPASSVQSTSDSFEPVPTQNQTAASPHASRFSTPDQFVKTLWPQAQQAAQQLGIQPEYLLAQAALETGWGNNVIAGSHNLFGIKADASWQGEQVSAVTTEMHDGKAFNVNAKFRAYPNFEASFSDYVKFIKTQPRYQQAVAMAADPHAYYQQLQTAGYATDPHYAKKVVSIAQQSRLQSLSDFPVAVR
jgi:flagellar protein FlgJ